MQLSGAEIVVECLKEQGVDTVFGYPGGTILNVYDALYKHQDEIHHILTSHEQGAAHAADGYARATGKVGVCLATSGPGATNLVTGIATAYMDSVPMVAITCNVNLPLLGKDSFQEVDIAGVTMPITKHGYIVKDVNILADTLRKAFAIAREGRPGPVLVDITKDVTAATCEYEKTYPLQNKKVCKYTQEDIDKAVSLIKEAKKPFVYVGGGAVISGASAEVREFAKILDAPVCDTLMGKGVIDGHSESYTGMIGMHGTKASNLGVSECDLLVALGARFSDRVVGNAALFAKGAKVLHIDIDAAEINKNIRTDAFVVGDLKEILQKVNKELPQMEHQEWMAHIKELKEKYPLNYEKEGLSCPFVMEEIDRVTEGKAVITTDVGQHQMWAAQYYKYSEPRTFISSGGLGTMGYGLGACIGAKMGRPDKICINIAGDGCFRMNMNELATASRYQIPIIQVVINNHVLGMVRQWQTLFYGKRYSQTVLDDGVDFCMVAKGLGCEAIRVTKKEEVAEAISKAIAAKKPVLIECVIPEDDKVFPMVPAGAPISEVFDATDLKKMKRKVLLKGCAIGGTVILLSVLAMYLGLSCYYMDGFSYGTWINGIYCTGKSINEVNDELLKECHYEGLTITDSDGKSYHILPEEVSLTFSYEESLSLYLKKQNPYLWIDNLAEKAKGRQLNPMVHYDEEAYEARIDELPIWQKKAEADRKVAIQKGSAGYVLINEREHVLDEELARQLIKEAFDGFETEINLEQAGCYRDLPLTPDMEETLSMWEKVSAYQDCGIVYQMGDEQVPVDAGVVCDFLLLDENGGFVTDENGSLCTDKNKVYDFVDRLAKEYDTVGGVRTFQATRGETVTVEGGLYGNKLDKKAEKEYLLDAFLNGKREVHTPEYTQMGWKQGKDDIGDTYIEVDMTEQMLYYYVDGKQEIVTPVVTGNTSLRRGTPTGTNFVYAKQRNRTLRGSGYESFVKYWIPVNRGIGIHDSSWRSEYGGELYKTGGSHGCINTPLEEVSRLYEIVEIGTPCVMFY